MHESGWGFSDTSHFSRTFKPSRSTSSVTATIPARRLTEVAA
jgi:hypothetical protein